MKQKREEITYLVKRDRQIEKLKEWKRERGKRKNKGEKKER